MKTTFKQFLNEEMQKAHSMFELTNSRQGGYFTRDGTDIDTSKFEKNGDFYIVHAKIKSLKGCPKKVSGTFSCYHNDLTTLEFGPKEVGNGYHCGQNALTSLDGVAQIIPGPFSCDENNLSSLKGGPVKVGEYHAGVCGLYSIEGIAKDIGGDLILDGNNLTSLKDIHKQVYSINGRADFTDNPLKSHVLGLLKIKNLTQVTLDIIDVEKIINKYLPEGDIFECQQELIDAGLEEYAQL